MNQPTSIGSSLVMIPVFIAFLSTNTFIVSIIPPPAVLQITFINRFPSVFYRTCNRGPPPHPKGKGEESNLELKNNKFAFKVRPEQTIGLLSVDVRIV